MGSHKVAISTGRIIWVLTLAFLSLICITANNVSGRFILLGIALLMLCIYLISVRGIFQLRLGRFHCHYLLFCGYIFLSSLWAWNRDAAISDGVSMLLVFLCVSMIYICYQDKCDLWPLYNAVKWSGFIVCIYTIYSTGIPQLLRVLRLGDRMSVTFANVNSVSILAAFSVIITFYERLYQKRNSWSVIFCIPAILIVAASGTRKAILMLLLGVGILLFFRFRDRNLLTSIIRITAVTLIAGVVLWLILSLPIFSGIMERMQGLLALVTGVGSVDSSAQKRELFINIGMAQFWKTPVFGIGIGNSGTLLQQELGINVYLHNNFVELLCCGGIAGFTIYYSMYVYCICIFWNHRNDNDPLAVLGFVMLSLMLMMDVARVSYDSKATIVYFMIFFLHVHHLKVRRDVS